MKAIIYFLLMLSVGLPCAEAQTQRSGGDAAARVMQQLQQLTAEKAKLQQDNEAIKKQLEETKAKLTQASAEQGKLQQRTRELEQVSKREMATKGSDEALEKTRMQLQELVGKYREMAQQLKEVETDRDTLRAGKATQDRLLGSCIDKNAQLYLLGTEVLDQYDKLGVWSALKSKESFTRLSRTRLENLADDYRDRIEALRSTDRSKVAASSK